MAGTLGPLLGKLGEGTLPGGSRPCRRWELAATRTRTGSAPTGPPWAPPCWIPKALGLAVHLRPLRQEFRRLLRHALLGDEIAHVLGDLHRAELRPAHGAEVRGLVCVLRHRF